MLTDHVTENNHHDGNNIVLKNVCLLTLSVTCLISLNWSLTACSKRRLDLSHPPLNRRTFESKNQNNFKLSCRLQNNYIINNCKTEICKYKVEAFGVARKLF